jgi:valine--pyruvate aminotransferase
MLNPQLSDFGHTMTRLTGVRAIMKDIVETLQARAGEDLINLSAGNPVILPEVEQLWRDCTQALLASPDYGEVVCRYGASQGYQPLIEAVVADFNQRYGLHLTPRNVLVTPGSQSLYFFAANAFGGAGREIVLPLSPDYTGYGGICLVPESLRAVRPTLEVDEQRHEFKYRPNFDQLAFGPQTGCVIFSRPCNPTGNVLSEEEVLQIAALAARWDIPVFVDSAYAAPYPALNFTPMTPVFAPNIVHCISLSKAGLPGERVGIAIGDEGILRVIEGFLTNACIHASRYGQALAAQAIASGALAHLSATVIRPHYQQKFALLAAGLRAGLPGDWPWFLHRGEGGVFAWLWLRDLPISDWELYQELKQAGVIVVPGHTFFPGLHQEWRHTRQCVRISLTASVQDIERGMERLTQVVRRVMAYRTVSSLVS